MHTTKKTNRLVTCTSRTSKMRERVCMMQSVWRTLQPGIRRLLIAAKTWMTQRCHGRAFVFLCSPQYKYVVPGEWLTSFVQFKCIPGLGFSQNLLAKVGMKLCWLFIVLGPVSTWVASFCVVTARIFKARSLVADKHACWCYRRLKCGATLLWLLFLTLREPLWISFTDPLVLFLQQTYKNSFNHVWLC